MLKNILVLIDTNVWISAFINKKGHPARVKEKFLRREFEIVVSPPLLKELTDVLKRPRIKDTYKIKDEEMAFLLRYWLE